MKKITISIIMAVLFGLAGSSAATSPQPEEVKPGQTATICTTHIVYVTDREKVISGEEHSSTFTFETSVPKKDVLQQIMEHMSDRLNEGHVSEFRIACRFKNQ